MFEFLAVANNQRKVHNQQDFLETLNIGRKMSEIMAEITEASLIEAGLYQHYKGSEYWVLGTARHSETEEWMVVYQALYGEKGFWLRPLSMFQENVNINGQQVPRFKKL